MHLPNNLVDASTEPINRLATSNILFADKPISNAKNGVSNRIVVSSQEIEPLNVNFSSPKPYTKLSLDEELRGRLNPDELKVVVNPLLTTDEINRWARRITTKAANDEAKAKMLFEELKPPAQVINTNIVFVVRTAQEAFAAWQRHDELLTCKDYAFLYVIMARAIGIKAYDVDVEEGPNGQKLSHACAAVIIGDKKLLVDPALGLYGASHKRFYVLNDLQSIGIFMGQLEVANGAEIACKLAPEIPLAQLNLFEHLINSDHLNEAREVLKTIKRVDVDNATLQYAEAKLATGEGKPEFAISLLTNAIAINRVESTYHIALAEAHAACGDITNTANSYKNALRCPMTVSNAQQIQKFLARIDELVCWRLRDRANRCLSRGDSGAARVCCDKVIQMQPDYADAYYMRAYIDRVNGDTIGASNDYLRAVKLKPDLAIKGAP